MTTTNTNTEREIKLAQSQTIANQIGNRAFFMMGAKNIGATVHDGKAALTFKIMSNAKGVTHVRVTLEPSDTYTVTFLKVRGTTITTVHESEDVYEDSLKSCIEYRTGLRLSL